MAATSPISQVSEEADFELVASMVDEIIEENKAKQDDDSFEDDDKTLAKANSFIQMQKVKGRVPSTCEFSSPRSTAYSSSKKAKDYEDEGFEEDSVKPQEKSEGKRWILRDLVLNDAQLKILGVKDQTELIDLYGKILGKKHQRDQIPNGPGLGRPTMEAHLSAAVHGKTRNTISLQRVHELAQTKKAKQNGWMTVDEKKNCTFIPRTKTKKSIDTMLECGYEFAKEFTEVTKETKKEHDLIDRLARIEKQRRKKLENARGKADYEARLDKKICPKCKIPQSYDEFIEKRMKCQQCGRDYKFKRTSQGLDAWLKLQDERNAQRRRDSVFDLTTNKTITKSNQTAFLQRVSDDIQKRRTKAQARIDDKRRQELMPPSQYRPPKKEVCHSPETKTTKKKFTLSKWEDDLEVYVRSQAEKRQAERQAKDAIARSAANRREKQQRSTPHHQKKKPASSQSKQKQRKLSASLSAPPSHHYAAPTTPSIDLAKFNDLLYDD